MGFALRLGEHRNAGDRGSATVRLQRGRRSHFLRVSVDRRGKFPPRRNHQGKVQRSDAVLRSARGTRVRNERGRLWLDQCRIPRTTPRPAERNGRALEKRTEPAAADREMTIAHGWTFCVTQSQSLGKVSFVLFHSVPAGNTPLPAALTPSFIPPKMELRFFVHD